MDPSGGIPPPSFNLAALFGFRQTGEPRWKYEPPSLRKAELSDFAFDFTSLGRSPNDSPPVSAYTFHPPDTVSDPSFPPSHTIVQLPDGALDLEQGHGGRRSPNADTSSGEKGLDAVAAKGSTVGIDSPPVPSEPITHATKGSVLKAAESPPIDLDACLDKFRELVNAVPTDVKEQPGTFLHEAYKECCPDTFDAGSFCLLAFQHLREDDWPVTSILGCLSHPNVRLPHVYDRHGLRFMQFLEEKHLITPDYGCPGTHLIYKRLAEQLSDGLPASPGLSIRGTHDHDTSLRLLIRGLWHSSRSEDETLAEPVVELLRGVAHQLSDPRLSRLLRKFWKAPTMEPVRLCNLVVACVQEHTSTSVVLDVLECIPAPLLRSWSLSMPAMLLRSEKSLTDLKLGHQTLHFRKWFELLWRLDMRNDTRTSFEMPLFQYAFKSFANAWFNHRYPPHTLVTALMYALVGHASFAGDDRLCDFIKSYSQTLIAQHDTGTSLNGMLARLVSDLGKRSMPNHGVLELMIPYISEHKSFHSVSNLLERVHKCRSMISNTAFLNQYSQRVLEEIKEDTDSTRLGYNLNAFERLLHAQHALGVNTAVQDTRVEQAKARRSFEHILDRANAARIVPLAYRKVTADIPKEVQADLIHQFAHQYAMDRTRSCQQNFRSIKYLYRYLVTNELPIRPLFTQAAVDVCITRPLSEDRFVPQKKALWTSKI
ncbi:hypothetical protein N0V90_010301 [Kalmusia sp. IMI 367209]|nr:hypothetical protein N0V90_010301 [Kalmusia sp. IMI 367209]